MKSLALKKALLGLLLACLSTGFAAAQSMSLTVTTKTYNGNYKPKHVLTCWITSSTGAYVYNVNRYGYSYLNSLTNWTAISSSTKTTDGVTGASFNSHSLRTFTWNCKNSAKAEVADGTYNINIEFTEQEGTKQYVKYSFVKGKTNTSVLNVVTANSYYATPALNYTAPAVALTTTEVTNFDFTYSPSDRNLQLEYDAANHTGIKLQLINLKGQTVYSKALKGFGKETTQLPACQQGIYLIRLTDKEGWSQTQKLLL